jgi:glutaminase
VDLSQQYLCSGMSEEELDSLRASAVECRFAPHQLIIKADDPADCLYFILQGEVEVMVDTDADHQLRLTTLGSGTVFGEVALVSNKRRTADVRATVDTVCLQVVFDALPDNLRTKMLVNLASYFASKIEQDTKLMQHLG